MKDLSTKTLLVGAILLATLGLASSPAQATDGICWLLCQEALAGCYIEADCWLQVCKDGGGPCTGGCSECITVPCPNAACEQAFSDCMGHCVDWSWLSALSTVTTLEIPDLVRQDLDTELQSLRLEIEAAVQSIEVSLATRLGQYRAEVEALRDNQQLDPNTANGLIEMANGVEASLGGGALIEYISDSPSPQN
ncbi:MAG: hypothetical protein AAGD06_15395 [Acidobacteriota bacterium]